jgi:hypothetical protein
MKDELIKDRWGWEVWECQDPHRFEVRQGGEVFCQYDNLDSAWNAAVYIEDTALWERPEHLAEFIKGAEPMTNIENYEGEEEVLENEDDIEDYEDYDHERDDEIEFADPGGRSALRAATKDDPRDLPCPNCGAANRLTRQDRALGYQCDACADRAERGCD